MLQLIENFKIFVKSWWIWTRFSGIPRLGELADTGTKNRVLKFCEKLVGMRGEGGYPRTAEHYPTSDSDFRFPILIYSPWRYAPDY